MLPTGVPTIAAVTLEELQNLAEAIRRFGQHPDRPRFHGTDGRWGRKARNWGTQLFLLQLLLFHTGQVAELPKEPLPATATWPNLSPTMTATIERYLAARRQLDRPATTQNIEAGLRRLATWLGDTRPHVRSFAAVTRGDCQEVGAWLDTRRHRRTGAPLAVSTKRSDLQAVLGFFRGGSAWEWPDMPARPLLIAGDLPKIPRAVPRFIPESELAPLMDAIRALPCPAPTPTAPRGCGFPPARPTPNGPSRSPTRPPRPYVRSYRCATPKPTGPCPATISSVPPAGCSSAKGRVLSVAYLFNDPLHSLRNHRPPRHRRQTDPSQRTDSGTPSAPNSPPAVPGYKRS